MKLHALVMLSVAGSADQLDPGFNPNRPRLNPQPAAAFTSISDFLPKRIKFDQDLYKQIDASYFSKGRFEVPTTRTGVVQDVTFTCGQNAMNLIVRTDQFEGLNVVEKKDFALLDTNCNSTVGYIEWEAVTDPTTGSEVELLIVDIPLDSCGTTATYDQATDEIKFVNTVRNGGYSIIQSESNSDTHNGITMDSIVDFSVTCRYNAVYQEIDIQTNAEHTALREAINDGNHHNFAMDIMFKQVEEESTRSDGLPTLLDFEGDPQYTVGDPAFFTVGMTHPNKQLLVYVESCTMVSGLDSNMNYTIVDEHCGDIFTHTKLIDQYAEGTSLISFTMFEFVSDIEKTVNQDNRMVCNVKLMVDGEEKEIEDKKALCNDA